MRVGRDEDGTYICNPTLPQYETGGMDLVVAGTADAVMMVEGGGNEISEDDFLGAIEFAHEQIKLIVAAIDKLAKKCGKAKRQFPLLRANSDLEKWMRKTFKDDVAKGMRVTEKLAREETLGKITVEQAIARCEDPAVKALLEDPILAKDFKKILKSMEEDELRVMVVDEKMRPDGRKPDEIRPIWSKVHYVPRVHGSGRLPRAARRRSSPPRRSARYATSSAWTGSSRSPTSATCTSTTSRRTRSARRARCADPAGARSATAIWPKRRCCRCCRAKEDFPYTLRLISEVLESNGSSSMASVCGSTLALMDAGVPIREHVAGVAMGLVLKGDKYAILTDIQGIEDALGEMDFKVAGTKKGITAIQMDIKTQGVTVQIMREAMAEAKKSRLFIIDKLAETIAEPRAELSKYAPRMIVVTIRSGQDQRRHRSRRQDHQQDHRRNRRREDRHRGRRQGVHHRARRRVG